MSKKPLSSTLSVKQLLPYLKIARTEGIGGIRYRQLLDHYQTPEAVLEILPKLKRSKDSTKKFQVPDNKILHREINQTLELGGQFVLRGTLEYPPLLDMLEDAPPILIAMGNIELLKKRNVAIVGARNASIHGIKMAENLAADLSAHQIGITSGLARGIDKAAHKGALYTGFTIAVIGCGIDIFYPTEHKDLQKSIAEKGVVLTEFSIGTQPQAMHFPRRNRIISGLSWGCIVIEAAQHSGSLITAKQALDYNRPVFAVPGSPIDPRCKGSNNLIRMGAILTENAMDIISELPHPLIQENTYSNTDLFTYSSAAENISLQNKNLPQVNIPDKNNSRTIEDDILFLLSATPTPIDLILRNVHYPTNEIQSALTLLEIQQKIFLCHNGYILK